MGKIVLQLIRPVSEMICSVDEAKEVAQSIIDQGDITKNNVVVHQAGPGEDGFMPTEMINGVTYLPLEIQWQEGTGAAGRQFSVIGGVLVVLLAGNPNGKWVLLPDGSLVRR